MNLDRELDEASAIAREAGRLLLEIYATDFEVAFKSKDDPVTAADRTANAYLVEELGKRFPGDGIVAEESDGHARGSKRVWYVDPLDGTKEFVAKNGEFSVMIGLSIDGEAQLGVVYRPVGDRLYRGVVGSGAELVHAGERRALRVSDVAITSKMRVVVSRSHRDARTSALCERLGIHEERQSGSVGLKVGLIAEREADLYVHLATKMHAWDACAPDAILRAAGGAFTGFDGTSYRYDGGSIAVGRGLLASNGRAHDVVVAAVSEMLAAAG